MLKQTLIATVTAGAIAAGALIATTAGAAASGPAATFGGPNWSVTIGGGYGPGPGYFPGGPRFCKPIVKNVRYWTRWGKPYWQQVVVGQDCGPRRGQHGPFPGGSNPGPFPPFPGGPHGGPYGGPQGPYGGQQGPGGWGNW